MIKYLLLTTYILHITIYLHDQLQKQLCFHPSMDALLKWIINVYFLLLPTNYEKLYNVQNFKMIQFYH